MSVETIRRALGYVDTEHPNVPEDCAKTMKKARKTLDALVNALNAACHGMGAEDAYWYDEAKKALGEEFEKW